MWGSSQSVGSGCMCVRGVCVSEENACVYTWMQMIEEEGGREGLCQ